MTRSLRPAVALALTLALIPFAPASAGRPAADPPRGYIVTLRPSSATGIRGPAMTLGASEATASVRAIERAVGSLESRLGFRATHRYAYALTGFAAHLTPAQVEALRRDPRVARLRPSQTFELAAEPAAQTVPTGVSRINGQPPAVSDPVDADVAILDTGLSALRTDELDFVAARGHNCVPPLDANGFPTGPVDEEDWHDFHGHGTHVAGTVGAKDNDIGVVGVAPGARIWAARVFGLIRGQAAGRTEWITCAVDWVASLTEPIPGDPEGDRRPVIEVVNMSLAGGGIDSPCSLDPRTPSSNPGHDAICRSVAAGTTYVVAAGNSSKDVQAGATGHVLPAAYDEVITVSALADSDGRPGGLGPSCSGADDGFGPYSNFGREVDLIAPGSCILSLGRAAGSVATMTGTSMASPAVAGAAAVYHAMHPEIADDPQTAPARVREGMRAAATLDWRWETDPDGDPDRLLDVSRSLDGAPAIALWATPSQLVVGSGDTQATYAIDLSRGGGFSGAIDLSTSGLPPGVTASFADDPLDELGGIETTLTLTIAPNAAEGIHEITVEADGAGGLHAEASMDLMVDHQPPDIDGPHARFKAGTTLLRVSARLAVSWSGSDALSGLDRYTLRQRIDGGSWLDVALPGALTDSATRQAQVGKDYEYEVRALDRAGNTSTVASPGFAAVLRQSTGKGVTIGPGWALVSHDDASGGTLHRSRRSGSRVTFDFTGRSVAWVAPVGRKQGRARVFLDGVDQGRVDLAATTRASRQLVYVAGWDESGAHRLEIVARSGTSGKPVGVDAFLVLID